MIRWTPYTFVRITLFLIGGIALGICYPDLIPEKVAQLLLLSLAAMYLASFVFFRFYNKAVFNPGFIGLSVVFLVGYVHLLGKTESRSEDHIIKLNKPVQFYRAVITRFIEEKERSWKTEARVLQVFDGEWKTPKGKVVLYFSKDAFPQPFAYGDVLLIHGSPDLVKPPVNPGEFDYKRFLSYRNIYHQQFLRRDDVKRIGYQPSSAMMAYAIKARVWADNTLKKFVNGEREQAIASALVLGVTDGLDNELLNAYAATGAMHVLAVSGLHISIIYMILVWLLKPLKKYKSGMWIIALISLAVLWAYAFITGLSPSVLRAVTMFSFLAIARPAGQNTNIYNTLSVSAFCLLLFDPFLIMSVGFQLSYLAVLGIVYLQNPLCNLWEPKTYLMDQVWKITCVSIAAQIATFALGLLYFHQFPNYFLLSNLLVIPGSFVVLILGIAVLAFSFIKVIAGMLGFLLLWMIKLLNAMVFMVEAFPFSLVENIYIDVFQCWLLMALVLTGAYLFSYKKFSTVKVMMLIVVMFAVLQWRHFGRDIHVRKFIVYGVNGHTAIDFIDRGKAYFLTDSILMNDDQKIRFHIKPNRLISGVDKVFPQRQLFVRSIPGGEIGVWCNSVVVVIKEKGMVLPDALRPDFIVIASNAVDDVPALSRQYPESKIILDSSNSYFYLNKVDFQTRREGIEIYSVSRDGAFEYTFNIADT